MKEIFINIYGIEGLFIIAFIAVLAGAMSLKNKLAKKEGWDVWGILIIIFVTIIFFGIYQSYEVDYRNYKTQQKAEWEEYTKNWDAEDWQHYEDQQNEPDYQPGAYGPE